MTFSDFFKNRMMYELKSEKPIGVMMRFNTERELHKDKRYVFVEGSSDFSFYRLSDIELLNHNSRYFFSKNSDFNDEEQKIVGKKAVIYCYLEVKNKLNNLLDNCTFIIDRDYDPDLLLEPNITSDDKKKICITKGHSFENYFFDLDNISRIMNYWNMDEADISQFDRELADFLNTTGRYFAAKAVITGAHGSGHMNYKCVFKDEDIFLYDIQTKEAFDKTKLNTEYHNMLKYIDDVGLKERYRTIKKMVTDNPKINVRGHNIYDFFVFYLLTHYGVILDYNDNFTDYANVVKKLEIEIYGINKARNE